MSILAGDPHTRILVLERELDEARGELTRLRHFGTGSGVASAELDDARSELRAALEGVARAKEEAALQATKASKALARAAAAPTGPWRLHEGFGVWFVLVFVFLVEMIVIIGFSR